jgi:hypothetical protein
MAAENLTPSICCPDYPPIAEIRRAALAERSLSATAAVYFIALQPVPVAGTAHVGG